MKTLVKSTIIFGLIVGGLLTSSKKQDGYSDEVQTNPNPTAADSAEAASDSSSKNEWGPAGKSAVGGTGDKGAGN